MVKSDDMEETLERRVSRLERLAYKIRIFFGITAGLAAIFGIGSGFAFWLIANASQKVGELRQEVVTLTDEISAARREIRRIQRDADAAEGVVELKAPPKVAITSPVSGLEVNREGDSVWFPVDGTSSNVAVDNVYVLVYSGTDWHVQKAATVGSDGRWSIDKAYIGDQTDPIDVGSELRIVAVVSSQQREKDEKVPSPSQLAPKVMSEMVKVRVKRVIPQRAGKGG